MLKGLFGKLWEVNTVMLLFGVFGFCFFGYAQENFYGSPNALKPIQDILWNQTSATSYFIVLFLSAAWTLLYLGVTHGIKFLGTSLSFVGLYLWMLVPLAVYNYYEIYQMFHPTYADNHVLDIIMSILATTTLSLVNTIRVKTLKTEIDIKIKFPPQTQRVIL